MLFIVFSRLLVVLAGNASSLQRDGTCGYRGTPRLDPGAEEEDLRVTGRGPGKVTAAARWSRVRVNCAFRQLPGRTAVEGGWEPAGQASASLV
jgi:hypothetical protein